MATDRVTISSAKAKRLGVPEEKRKGIPRAEYDAIIAKSGQYTEVSPGKWTFTENIEARKAANIEAGIDEFTGLGSLAPVTTQEEVAPTKQEPVISPTIKAEPPIQLGAEKTGIAALVEEDTALGKFAKVITSPKTTLVLGGVLATLLTAPALITAVTTRAIVGRAVPELIKFGAGRFLTNPKTIGSSISMLSKIGLTLGAASLFAGAVGSYPFAGFLKEEALQTLNIGIFKAVDAGDLEGAARLVAEVDEILDNEGNILSKIPYANVLESLKLFFSAASETNKEWKRILEKRVLEASGEQETDFARERRISDEAAFERKREFAAEEEERFGKIREEGEARIEEETARFADIREASQQRELDELNFKEQYFALIREGRYEEAAALLDAYEAKLKGGA